MVVSRWWITGPDSFRNYGRWIPPLIGDSVRICLGDREHIAVTWTPELRVWHLHDIIKDQFGYLDRNRMCLSADREKEEKRRRKERVILGFDDNPRPNEVLDFSYWPVESWDRDTLIDVKIRTTAWWKSVRVPPNYSEDDVWAAIATCDPLALENRMSLIKEDDSYRVSWNPMSRREWLTLYGQN